MIGKPKLIRKINRALVIKIIRDKGLVTTRELSNLTGLSRRTINLIISSLKNKDIVLENGLGESTKEGGKKPVIYKFNSDALYTIGISIREKNISIGISNLKGNLTFINSIDVDWKNGYKQIINDIIKLIKNVMKESKIDHSRYLGIGIGLPGLVDFKKKTIKILSRHDDWKNIPLAEIIEKELNIQVEIENENYVRALGEKWFGIARKINNFVTIMTTDYGIGCGVIINNKLLRSNNSLCGEVGHSKFVYISDDASKLVDIEYILSGKFANKIINDNKNHKSFKKSPLLDGYSNDPGVSLQDLFENYNKNDAFSKMIMDEISNYFIQLLTIIICTYDPDLIIIHGKYSLLNDGYFKNITCRLEEMIFPGMKKKITIKKSLHSKEALILGAVGMILDEVAV